MKIARKMVKDLSKSMLYKYDFIMWLIGQDNKLDYDHNSIYKYMKEHESKYKDNLYEIHNVLKASYINAHNYTLDLPITPDINYFLGASHSLIAISLLEDFVEDNWDIQPYLCYLFSDYNSLLIFLATYFRKELTKYVNFSARSVGLFVRGREEYLDENLYRLVSYDDFDVVGRYKTYNVSDKTNNSLVDLLLCSLGKLDMKEFDKQRLKDLIRAVRFVFPYKKRDRVSEEESYKHKYLRKLMDNKEVSSNVKNNILYWADTGVPYTKLKGIIENVGFYTSFGNTPTLRGKLFNTLESLSDKTYLAVRDRIDTARFKRLTYESLVNTYLNKVDAGFTFDSGDNKPTFSKQARRAGYEPSQLLTQAVAETKHWFMGLYSYRDADCNFIDFQEFADNFGISVRNKHIGNVYLDTQDVEIYNNPDPWSFGDSCNNLESTAGSDTHLVFKALGGKVLKMYTEAFDKEGNFKGLIPLARTMFYTDGTDVAHAGTYSALHRSMVKDKMNKTAYLFTSLLLGALTNHTVEEFESIDGILIRNDETVLETQGRTVYVWSNLSHQSGYTKRGTRPELLVDIDTSLIENTECLDDYGDYKGYVNSISKCIIKPTK